MNNITISQMMERSLALKAKGQRFTHMGIGPMSPVCIEAALESAMERDYPVMLIASRNQVDSDSFGHGYVCGWNQQRFIADTMAIARRIDFDGLCYFCRDHGGPWQRDEERSQKLSVDEAMRLSIQSYIDDMRAGFHLLHIDPTKDPHISGTVPLSLVLARTVELIKTLEKIRAEENLPNMAYEVGAEETNGGLTGEDAFKQFITDLWRRLHTKGLPKPDFIVGQTGTLTRLTENVGQINFESAARLSAIAEGMKVGIKQHNSDYLSDSLLLYLPYLGVTAANIAPEFGVVETRAYLELAKIERVACGKEASCLQEAITREAVCCGRWRKWMVTKEEQQIEDVLKDKTLSELITDISGHYTFEHSDVKEQLAVMTKNLKTKNIDTHQYVVKKVRDSIERYAFMFGLYGLTSKLV